jgi:hypothetical protein
VLDLGLELQALAAIDARIDFVDVLLRTLLEAMLYTTMGTENIDETGVFSCPTPTILVGFKTTWEMENALVDETGRGEEEPGLLMTAELELETASILVLLLR